MKSSRPLCVRALASWLIAAGVVLGVGCGTTDAANDAGLSAETSSDAAADAQAGGGDVADAEISESDTEPADAGTVDATDGKAADADADINADARTDATTDSDTATDANADADAATDTDTDTGPDPCPAPPFPPIGPNPAPAKPDVSACTWPAPKFFSEPPPAETLKPTLGIRDLVTDGWSALQDDAWLGMHVGPQGSFHVFAAYRAAIPGESGTYAKMQVETWLSDGCTIIAKGNKPVSFDYPVSGQAASFGNSEKGEIGILVEFGNPAVDVPKFCGRWAQLHLRIKHMASGSWGSTSRWVRLYDAGKK